MRHKGKFFLVGIVVLLTAVSLTLVACNSAANTATATATPTAVNLTLNIYNWDTYIDPDILAAFEAEYGVTIHYDTFDSNEELLDIMLEGERVYDLVIPTDYMVSVLIRRELITPLNKDNIPNLRNISADFRNPTYDPGSRYCVPYQWGTMGLGYDITAVGRELTSWQDALDPAYAGRVALLDDPRSVLGTYLLYLGYSPNTTNRREIGEAQHLISDNISQFAAFAPDTGQDLLNDGTVDITFEWSGDIFQIMEENPNIRYSVPQEGALVWTDNMCIPTNAANQELAETFINYILRADVGAQLSNYIRYATPNEAALPLINEEDRNNPNLYPPEEVQRRLFFTTDLGPDMNAYYNEVWDQILATQP